MSNKRALKKRISEVCGDIARDAMLAAAIYRKDIDTKKIDDVLRNLAELQEETLVKSNFSFDKSEREFETRAAYRKARRDYFATAYDKLNKDFVERAVAIVKELNEAVPTEARKQVSELK